MIIEYTFAEFIGRQTAYFTGCCQRIAIGSYEHICFSKYFSEHDA